MYKIIGNDQKTYGPVDAGQIRRWMAEGRVNNATLIQTGENTPWVPLATLPEFAPPAQTPDSPKPPPPSIPPPVGQPEESRRIRRAAVIGFVAGLISLTPCCCLSIPAAIVGVIYSSTALSHSDQLQDSSVKGMAIAGLILSLLGLLGIFLFHSYENPMIYHLRHHGIF